MIRVSLFIDLSFNPDVLNQRIFSDRAPLDLKLRLTNVWSCRSTSTTRSKTERDTRWSLMGKYVRIHPSLFTGTICLQPHNQRKVEYISPCRTFHLGVILDGSTGTQKALALCWRGAIVASSRRYNVLLLYLMNSLTASNCSYAYE